MKKLMIVLFMCTLMACAAITTNTETTTPLDNGTVITETIDTEEVIINKEDVNFFMKSIDWTWLKIKNVIFFFKDDPEIVE